MFSRWGAFVYRHRRPVALVALLLALASLSFAAKASSALSSGGWLDPTSESGQVSDRLAAEFGAGRSDLVVLVRSTSPGADATSPAFQAALGRTLAPLKDDPSVSNVIGYASTGDRRFISTKGDATYAVVELKVSDEESVPLYPDLRAKLVPPAGYTIEVSGYAPFTIDQSHQAERDLARGESVSLPLAVLILLAVFGSIVAAGMPLAVGALAIPSSLALVYLVAQRTTMAVFTLNIATMLGLALAIDYSLFIVSRFREELRRGRPVGAAVEKAIATSGKAITFSGLAVAIGLSGLLVFPFPALASIGIASALVVACSVFYALTFLPAVLSMLGPRVEALTLSGVLRLVGVRRGPMATDATLMERSRWGRLARGVMRHPVLVLVPIVVLLFVLGSPFFRLQQGIPGAETMPKGLESRDAYAALQSEFASGETAPITVLADVRGDPLSAANIAAVSAFADRIRGLQGIDRVEGPFTLTDPSTGQPLPLAQVQQLYAAPAAARPPGIASLLARDVRGSTVRLDAITPYLSSRPEGTDLVPRIRSLPSDGLLRVQVGGVHALGADFLAGEAARLPLAVGWTMLATAVVLFLLFGSVAIPLKAVIMTLLSASASFGALVWIFQEGNLAGALSFDPVGYTIAGLPVIMFCVIFGLSMDYEVLLLSRIQEAYRRTADNTASVAEGLVRTARVITGAALIMVGVFAAFALAEDLSVKSVGVGLAIAVFLDATIVRVLLVPATMRLLGLWNWWAPGPLKRLADSVGFDHVEDEATPEELPSSIAAPVQGWALAPSAPTPVQSWALEPPPAHRVVREPRGDGAVDAMATPPRPVLHPTAVVAGVRHPTPEPSPVPTPGTTALADEDRARLAVAGVAAATATAVAIAIGVVLRRRAHRR